MAEGKKIVVKANLEKLNKFIVHLGDLNGLRVRVGILKNSPTRTDDKESNASIGIVHEFGSITKHIPERSFLRMPLTTHQSEIIKEAKKDIEENLVNGTVRQKLQSIGTAAENVISEAFETGGFGMWPPIAAATAQAKNSSAILIDTGELSRSILSTVVKKGS